MLSGITPIISLIWNRIQMLREDDRGMTVEMMILTALLAAAALAAAIAIVGGIKNKQNDITNDLNSNG
jgi:Flp pilus assembly pilin Flp